MNLRSRVADHRSGNRLPRLRTRCVSLPATGRMGKRIRHDSSGRLEQGVANRIDDDRSDEDGGHDDHHPHTPSSAAAAGSPSPAAQRGHRPAGAAAAVSPGDGRDARDLREARRVLVAKRLHRRFERGGVPAGGKRSGCPDESGVASSRRFDLIVTVLAEPCPHMRGVADVVAIVRRRTAGWGRRRHGEPARARGPQARSTCDAAS